MIRRNCKRAVACGGSAAAAGGRAGTGAGAAHAPCRGAADFREGIAELEHRYALQVTSYYTVLHLIKCQD